MLVSRTTFRAVVSSTWAENRSPGAKFKRQDVSSEPLAALPLTDAIGTNPKCDHMVFASQLHPIPMDREEQLGNYFDLESGGSQLRAAGRHNKLRAGRMRPLRRDAPWTMRARGLQTCSVCSGGCFPDPNALDGLNRACRVRQPKPRCAKYRRPIRRQTSKGDAITSPHIPTCRGDLEWFVRRRPT